MIINLTFCDEFCVVSIIAKDKEIIRILMVQKCTACSLNFSLIRFRGAFCVCILDVLQSCCKFLKKFNISA